MCIGTNTLEVLIGTYNDIHQVVYLGGGTMIA